MKPLRPGQSLRVDRVMVIAVSGEQAHAYEFSPAALTWDLDTMASRPGAQPNCEMTIAGPMKRQTKSIPKELL